MTVAHARVAVLLAGGRASRFGSDKTDELVDGVSLRRRAIDAVPAGVPVLVAGPERDGGPAAALLATLRAQREADGAAWVLVLAADQPFAASAVPLLFSALGSDAAHDGVIGVDPSGHRQPLLAVYGRVPLLAALTALPDDARDAGLLRAVSGLRLTDVPLDADQVCDVDTVEDLRRAREVSARRGGAAAG